MATVKNIIQAFCHRMNLPAPTSFVGVSTPTEQQYLEFFRQVGDNLRNRPYQWPQLKRPYTFTTGTGIRNYRLPGDFYRMIEGGQWDTTNHWPLVGAVSDYRMNIRQFAIVSVSTKKVFKIIGPTSFLYNTSPYVQRNAGFFEVDPPGQNNTDVLFLGYISCSWTWPVDWAATTVYAAGSIVSGDGNIYITAAGGTSGSQRPNWTDSGSDGVVTWTVYREPYLAVPENAKFSDNDLCLFDDDLMIEGMRWVYLRAKKMDYQQERTDWDNQVKSAFARFEGPSRGNMNDFLDNQFPFPNVPLGSWTI